mgnify:CR=1 FL=1
MSHLFCCDVRHFWLWFAVFADKESDSFGVTHVTYIIALTMRQTLAFLITLVLLKLTQQPDQLTAPRKGSRNRKEECETSHRQEFPEGLKVPKICESFILMRKRDIKGKVPP